MEGVREDGDRQMGWLGEMGGPSNAKLNNWDFCPEGDEKPLNVSEPENEMMQSLRRG